MRFKPASCCRLQFCGEKKRKIGDGESSSLWSIFVGNPSLYSLYLPDFSRGQCGVWLLWMLWNCFNVILCWFGFDLIWFLSRRALESTSLPIWFNLLFIWLEIELTCNWFWGFVSWGRLLFEKRVFNLDLRGKGKVPDANIDSYGGKWFQSWVRVKFIFAPREKVTSCYKSSLSLSFKPICKTHCWGE